MTLPFDQTPYMSHPHQFFAQMYTAQHHPQQQPLIPLPAPHQHPHAHPQADPSFAGEPSSSTAGGVERKRPKYTRSKTGCMTCRHKKIKCDERKPICSRCSHGQRECTWPEGLPKKKAAEAKRKRNTSEEGDEDTTRRSDSPPSTAGGNGPNAPAGGPDGTAAFNGLLSPTSPRHPYTASSYATGNAAAVAAANYGTYRQPLPSPQYPPTPISGGSHFSSAAGFPPTPVSAQFRSGAAAAGAAAAANAAATRGSRSGSASAAGGLSAFDPSLLALPSLSTASPYSSSNHTPNASYTGSPNPSEDYHSGGEASGSYSSDTAYSSGASAGAGAGSGGSVEKFYLPGEKLYYTGEKEKHWNANGGSTMFTSPDPIEPYFRTVQERNLVGTRSFF